MVKKMFVAVECARYDGYQMHHVDVAVFDNIDLAEFYISKLNGPNGGDWGIVEVPYLKSADSPNDGGSDE